MAVKNTQKKTQNTVKKQAMQKNQSPALKKAVSTAQSGRAMSNSEKKDYGKLGEMATNVRYGKTGKAVAKVADGVKKAPKEVAYALTYPGRRKSDPRELEIDAYKVADKVKSTAKKVRTDIQYKQDKKMFGPTVAENLRKNPVNGKEGKALRLGLAQQDVITANARRQQEAKKKSKQTDPVKEKGAVKRAKK